MGRQTKGVASAQLKKPLKIDFTFNSFNSSAQVCQVFKFLFIAFYCKNMRKKM